MPWSPRQLAELTGVSVKAIRYYHQIGVLAEPGRASNGYRQYTFAHLLRLLQIKRLTDLRVPLSQIPELDHEGAEPTAVLRAAQTEVGELIRSLQQVQHELGALIRHGGPVDVPPGFEGIAETLSEADRSMLLVCARLLDDRSMAQLRTLTARLPRTAAEDAFDTLPAEASEEQIARAVALLATRPTSAEPRASSATTGQTETADEIEPGSAEPAETVPDLALRDRYAVTAGRQLITAAITELYNPAQREVLRRLEQRRSPA